MNFEIRITKFSVLLVLYFAFNLAMAEVTVPAFPGAEGAGAYASGGRGGKVYIVTNTNSSGPGSLADAVSQPNRFIVFAVSGIIDLLEESTPGQISPEKAEKFLAAQKQDLYEKAEEENYDEEWLEKKLARAELKSERITEISPEPQLTGGRILIAQPNITIAGQTAPGEGITLIHGSLNINASNVIVQNLRVRRGFISPGQSGDGITVKGGEKVLEDIIIDHCSSAWTTDENITVTGRVNNVTVQYSIAAEGCDYFNRDQTPPRHSEGSLFGSVVPGGVVSFHHIIYANNRLRNPRVTGGIPDPLALMDLRNCVVSNWIEYSSHTGSGGARLNFISNYYKPGVDTWPDTRSTIFTFKNRRAPIFVYASGNYLDGDTEISENNWLGIKDNSNKLLTFDDTNRFDNGKSIVFKVDRPFNSLEIETHSATDAYRICLEEAGAILPGRDPVDDRIIRDVRWGAGRVIDTENDLPEDKRWPEVWSLSPYPDADADGVPDYWEIQYGLNANHADAMEDADRDGYRNVEEYVHNMHPVETEKPVVWISAQKPRANKYENEPAEFRISRKGRLEKPLKFFYKVFGTAEAGADFRNLQGKGIIPAGARYTVIRILPILRGKTDMGTRPPQPDQSVVIEITPSDEYFTGCPGKAMIVIKEH